MPNFRPDPDHDAVLNARANHLVVTAPPGTGKTCLSVRLAAHISSSLKSKEKVLVLTFSNQARTQLEREAARQLTPSVRKKIHITNYHRFFWRGVSAYRRALGLPMHLDIGSRQRRQDALESAEPTLAQELRRPSGSGRVNRGALVRRIPRCTNAP